MTAQWIQERNKTLTGHCTPHCDTTGMTGVLHQWQQRLVRLWRQRIANQLHFLGGCPHNLAAKQNKRKEKRQDWKSKHME